jgi:hypothetical protein
MSGCGLCGDKGIVRVCYHSGEPEDFGVCVCPIGRHLLETRNAWTDTGIALWQVWASREQIPVERIFDLWDLMPADELGGGKPISIVKSRESALLNASRKKPRL